MDKGKLSFGLVLFALGLLGVLSMLSMNIPLPAEAKAVLESEFSSTQIKFLLLINPTIMLLVAVILGTLLSPKVDLGSPVLERITGLRKADLEYLPLIKYGVLGGLLSGVLLTLVGFGFEAILPHEFKQLNDAIEPRLAARFLYGGFTEEIMMRFGLMTLLVWLGTKLLNNQGPLIYWVGIFGSALLFALGHLPVAFQVIDSPSLGLLGYILVGNSIGGIIFGWLYWKRGLESAFIAHIITHIIILLSGYLMS